MPLKVQKRIQLKARTIMCCRQGLNTVFSDSQVPAHSLRPSVESPCIALQANGCFSIAAGTCSSIIPHVVHVGVGFHLAFNDHLPSIYLDHHPHTLIVVRE